MTEYGRRKSWTIIYPSVRSVGLFDMKLLGLTKGGMAVVEVERRVVDVCTIRGVFGSPRMWRAWCRLLTGFRMMSE